MFVPPNPLTWAPAQLDNVRRKSDCGPSRHRVEVHQAPILAQLVGEDDGPGSTNRRRIARQWPWKPCPPLTRCSVTMAPKTTPAITIVLSLDPRRSASATTGADPPSCLRRPYSVRPQGLET